ncbi:MULTISPECIES: hypothetical protein [Micromonospora]|uniref:Uncharacterized protein n=1 Tax=Micromonospora yangpuensis TaxID=683228 RepID=A0A1C6UYB6_9ACTN|nr:hypothetical protein [Micromonospora yangpuensis]GGL94830.1 hypothetical protein GCM10012279_10300 [Micromonospora yangpuensis]SCL58834.1 hypothetical protein GA0070617_3930 [Micromonospora yangpuensis]
MSKVGSNPDGTPIVQLPPHYRVAGLADLLGVRPEHLTRLDQPGGYPLDQHLLDGTVTDAGDASGGGSGGSSFGGSFGGSGGGSFGDGPAQRYVARAARSTPGARLFVLAQPPAAPPVVELIRLAVGLDLAVTVVACDHRHDAADPTRLHGVRWRVDVTGPAAEVDLRQPWWPSLEAAATDCLAHLGSAVRQALPTSPHRPLPAPTWPADPDLPSTPTGPMPPTPELAGAVREGRL